MDKKTCEILSGPREQRTTMRCVIRTRLMAALAFLFMLGSAGGVAADPAQDAFNRQDFATALRIWRAEAESGNPTSRWRIAQMYQNGWGVKRDPVEAVRWYRMAAERGSAMGQMEMAQAYRTGVGVKRDYAEAARWYLLAGEKSYGIAHLFLAEIYAKGDGVPQDFVEAYKWYTIYASAPGGRGVTEAHRQDILAERDAMAVSAKMTPEQIAEAETRAGGWMPKC